MGMSVITTEGLTKRFGPVTAVDGLTVRVPMGITGLVGSNGAGKSTLLKILLGLLPATTGTASVLDLDVAPLVRIPCHTHTAQGSLLVVEDGCRDAVDAGGELSHGHEVPVPLDLA